jgi:hypothetical protein
VIFAKSLRVRGDTKHLASAPRSGIGTDEDLGYRGRGDGQIWIEETITSRSAGLLVSSSGGTATDRSRRRRCRVGEAGTPRVSVTLRTLDKSRDANGQVRPWRLEFATTNPNLGESISATVMATTQIPIARM